MEIDEVLKGRRTAVLNVIIVNVVQAGIFSVLWFATIYEQLVDLVIFSSRFWLDFLSCAATTRKDVRTMALLADSVFTFGQVTASPIRIIRSNSGGSGSLKRRNQS